MSAFSKRDTWRGFNPVVTEAIKAATEPQFLRFIVSPPA
jgi:hypothetical protein